MIIGEVCILTRDVVRLANFYKALLRVDNGSDDDVHQFILSEETTLTVLRDDAAPDNPRDSSRSTIAIAFTVGDIEAEYARLLSMGVEVLSPPTARPWGATNMGFRDPDGNVVTFRSFPG